MARDRLGTTGSPALRSRPERGIYDCESEAYIHDDGIDVVADNVIAWLDGSGIIDDQGNASPDDLTGEYASDWDAVVAMFDQWEKIKLSQ